MGEQDRINAMISYFFLGPLFLLAKKDTPLADSYVKGHAKRASIIIGIACIIYIAYAFLLKGWVIGISLPGGIGLHTIVLALIVGVCILFLLSGAYKAYHGGVENSTMDVPTLSIESHTDTVDNDEEKIRILASMIPFVGIYLTEKYDHPLMRRGRIISSTVVFIFLLSLLFSSSEGILGFLIMTLGILIFVVEGVYLFVYDRWLSLDILDKLPSYDRVESHIIATMRICGQFIGVVFGKEKKYSYSEILSQEINTQISLAPTEKYFMPAGLIALPFWNILTLPSLFTLKYREYRSVTLQGLMITLIYAYLIFSLHDYSSPIFLMLLFPIVHICIYAARDTAMTAPGVGLILRVSRIWSGLFLKVKNAQNISQDERYMYEVSEEK